MCPLWSIIMTSLQGKAIITINVCFKYFLPNDGYLANMRVSIKIYIVDSLLKKGRSDVSCLNDN